MTWNIKLFILTLSSLLLGCSRNYKPDVNEYGYGEENASEFNKSMELFKDTLKKEVFLFFPSNPFGFDTTYKILVFDKSKIVYFGKYSNYFYIPKPSQDKNNLVIANFTILFCKQHGDKMRKYLFKNDKSFKWKDEFRCLYVDINPENPSDNNTFFYPTVEKIYL